MHTLLLLRHAKSSWDEPALADHDRPLNARGQRDAPRMASFIVQRGLVPDVILSSSANRARSTALVVAEACDFSPELRVTRALYMAEPEDFLQALAQLPSHAGRVLVVAHNPGLEDFLEALTTIHERLPTAALAVVEPKEGLALDGQARLVEVARPKELS
jgi:phosphohistidine phosphatase